MGRTLRRSSRAWVPTYTDRVFSAGMRTTGRSESINAFFDGFVNHKSNLIDFAFGYDKALERRNFKKSWKEAYIILRRRSEVRVTSRAGRSTNLKSVLGARESQSSVGAGDNFNVQSDPLLAVQNATFSSGTPICTQTSQPTVIQDPHVVQTKGRTSKRLKGPLEHPRSVPKLCRGCNQLVVGHDKRNCPQLKSVGPSLRPESTAYASIGRGRGMSDGGSISKSGDEVSSHSQSYSGMEKIVELESDFGDLVGCVSDLKDFQLAESTRLKLTSQAELQQLKEKIRRLEEAESKRQMKMDYLNRLIALHSAMFCIIFAALCYLAFWM
ncbi:hypothetical protein ACLOJK_020997 [Asimina triloba]